MSDKHVVLDDEADSDGPDFLEARPNYLTEGDYSSRDANRASKELEEEIPDGNLREEYGVLNNDPGTESGAADAHKEMILDKDADENGPGME